MKLLRGIVTGLALACCLTGAGIGSGVVSQEAGALSSLAFAGEEAKPSPKKEAPKEAPKKEDRDPNQRTWIIADFDGTYALNFGNFVVFRVADVNMPGLPAIQNLPEEVQVPVYDFEGNLGNRIDKRLGRLDANGQFIPGTNHSVIELSNGQKIMPALYYLDPQRSYREFRTLAPGKLGLSKILKDKVKANTPFLLEAFPFMAFANDPENSDRFIRSFLTMRGHDPEEMRRMDNDLHKQFKLPTRDWVNQAYVNLTHVDFSDFSASKVAYLAKAYFQLSKRVLQNNRTPHYLVVFENDRRHLESIDKLFRKLANQGVFHNPVVPILVNLVEEEVFNNPGGIDWNRNPDEFVPAMHRVSIYRPNDTQTTNELEAVLELTAGLTKEEAKKKLNSYVNGFACNEFLAKPGTGRKQ